MWDWCVVRVFLDDDLPVPSRQRLPPPAQPSSIATPQPSQLYLVRKTKDGVKSTHIHKTRAGQTQPCYHSKVDHPCQHHCCCHHWDNQDRDTIPSNQATASDNKTPSKPSNHPGGSNNNKNNKNNNNQSAAASTKKEPNQQAGQGQQQQVKRETKSPKSALKSSDSPTKKVRFANPLNSSSASNSDSASGGNNLLDNKTSEPSMKETDNTANNNPNPKSPSTRSTGDNTAPQNRATRTAQTAMQAHWETASSTSSNEDVDEAIPAAVRTPARLQTKISIKSAEKENRFAKPASSGEPIKHVRFSSPPPRNAASPGRPRSSRRPLQSLPQPVLDSEDDSDSDTDNNIDDEVHDLLSGSGPARQFGARRQASASYTSTSLPSAPSPRRNAGPVRYVRVYPYGNRSGRDFLHHPGVRRVSVFSSTTPRNQINSSHGSNNPSTSTANNQSSGNVNNQSNGNVNTGHGTTENVADQDGW